MKAWNLAVGLALVLGGLTRAWGANSVVVESRECASGAHNVVIGIKVSNDDTLCGLVVPLQIKQVTPGSFITKLRMSYGSRLSGVLTGVVYGAQHDDTSGSCHFGVHHGFAHPIFDNLGYSDTVTASPEGVIFVRARDTGGDLLPGTDALFATASIFLTVDVTDSLGTFEIDTACVDPYNHLMFVRQFPDAIPVQPAFTKGTITIASCNCPHQGDIVQSGFIDAQDVLQTIKVAFTNGADFTDPTCPYSRCDVYNLGFVDVADVLYIIKTAFTNGPQPINPCQ